MRVKYFKPTKNSEFSAIDDYEIVEEQEFCRFRFWITDSESRMWNKKLGRFGLQIPLQRMTLFIITLIFAHFVGKK